MTAAPLPVMPLPRALRPACGWCRNAGAAAAALALHGLVLVGLLGQWQSSPVAKPEVRTLTTQLISLAPPAAPAPPVPEQAVVAPPEPAPVKPVVTPPVEPRLQQHKLEQAALARQRVAERERKQEQQRQAQQQQQQQRLDQQRRAAEQLAQQQAQQRLAEQQAQAAERARQAEAAAAASRQYLPIAKEAPDYPDRALDKGIEGDCSVTYTVTAQGRVADPQVAGDCHPLFVRPSLAAAKSFRYQPRIVAGQAVAVVGVKNTFHYRIE